jgi:hypothetical protein
MAVTRSVFLTAVFTPLQPGGLLLIVRHKKISSVQLVLAVRAERPLFSLPRLCSFITFFTLR